jgi:hypothetical protein
MARNPEGERMADGCNSQRVWAISVYAPLGWLPALEPWMIPLATIVTLICGCLSLASFISAVLNFFSVQKWVLRWIALHRAKRAVLEYIPHMTKVERKIVGYLLAKNQKTITAAIDGGHAATLI